MLFWPDQRPVRTETKGSMRPLVSQGTPLRLAFSRKRFEGCQEPAEIEQHGSVKTGGPVACRFSEDT